MSALISRNRKAGVFIAFAVAAAQLSSGAPASAQALFPGLDVPGKPGRPSEFIEAAVQGLGDRQNGYAWSMAWFKGKLYVGTGRASFCVQQATLRLFQPKHQYPPKDKDIACTLDPRDLPLQAEIWRWTPDMTPTGPGTWDRVYQSPNDVPIQGTDKVTSRDIGYRGMVVFKEADGTEALYVAGDTTRAGPDFPGAGFDGPVPPPRILRSVDGELESFHALPQTPGTLLGDTMAAGFRTLVGYKGKLYVVATNGQLGHGVILEAAHPEMQGQGNPPYDAFRKISPEGMTFFEIETYNSFLWAGTGVNPQNDDRPFSLLKTDAAGDLPYQFTTVIPEGAYGKKPSPAVISLNAFKNAADVVAGRPGRLYVGTDKEVFRVNPDDTWDLVVGLPRKNPQGRMLEPISGFTTGWDNFFNIHMWRMGIYPGSPQSVPWLYIGTQDQSVKYRNLKGGLGETLKQKMGFDLYATGDGWHYSAISLDGFGDLFNSGMRNMVATPYGFFLGSSNHYYGTRIYRGANLPNPVPTPQRVEVEAALKVAGLTWEGGCPLPAASPRMFHVFRSTGFDKAQEIAVVDGTLATGCSYIDTVKPYTVYHYYVVAEDASGRFSEPSNTMRVPFKGPIPTFKSLGIVLSDWAAPNPVPAALSGDLAAAKASVDADQYPNALATLQHLGTLLGANLKPHQAEDFGILLAKFSRRVVLAQAGALPKSRLMK